MDPFLEWPSSEWVLMYFVNFEATVDPPTFIWFSLNNVPQMTFLETAFKRQGDSGSADGRTDGTLYF